MLAQRLNVKLFLRDPSRVRPRDFIPVFHRFIQQQRLNELMIDVTDYSHVQGGPGVALICHAANYFTDEEGGRLGLLYARKRDAEGDFPVRLASAVRAVLAAARHLEQEPLLVGRVVFDGGELLVRVNDRLNAPNSDEGFAALQPSLEALGARLYAGSPVQIARLADPRECLGARLTAPESPSVATLLDRLAG
ncbi:MAG: hypothetical protein EXR72_10285 [Myxococcales bacterium]|nr:hypothetical protein [Myxococcales bacterium]